MQIIHKLEDFLYDLFPSIKKAADKNEALKAELARFYTIGDIVPEVEIENGWVTIIITEPKLKDSDLEFKKVLGLCDRKVYGEAKKLLNKLLSKNKTNSEYYRVYGQIFSEEGNQDDAIDCLIDALRWNPKNVWALIMMGNIFARHKNDIQTAMKYYDQALTVEPDNIIAINNIGANLMQQEKTEAAKKYFAKVLELNPNYPNTHYALGMIAEIENNLHDAFAHAITAVKKNSNKDALFQNSVNLAFDITKKIVTDEKLSHIINAFAKELSSESGKPIDFVEDREIATAAKIELAETHNRLGHLVKYNPEYPANAHLQMHELVHLMFTVAARNAGNNMLFTTNQEHRSRFRKKISFIIPKLKKMGHTEDNVEKFIGAIFDGLATQIYNIPIDLFIEEFLYSKYETLRPFQFISLFNIVKQGLDAVTRTEITNVAPSNIISISKIYNLTVAMHFKDLYGVDLIDKFKATVKELASAKLLYGEFVKKRTGLKPGEEYEMVLKFAEETETNDIFELIGENKYNELKSDINQIVEAVENDPYGLNDNDIYRKREEEKFQETQQEIGFNPAVSMYMVDALGHFKNMADDKIKAIAMEIAMIGMNGISPDKKVYKVNLMPGKEFSGYHLLAYYYVSWQLAMPKMVAKLGLNYQNEYEMALKLFKEGK